MKYNRLGSSNLLVSELALGTMTFGEQNTEEDAHNQLTLAVAHGINFIDTAEMYPVAPRAETCFRTEQYVGSWLKNQQRDKLIISTKIAGAGRGMPWIREGPRVNKEQIQQAVEGSLRRLNTDYIDLYNIHWPDRYVPMFGQTMYDASQDRETTTIIEQLRTLSDLVDQGKIRYIGLSNETPYGVSAFLHCAEKYNLNTVVSVQNGYSLLNRTFESGLAEVCHHGQVGLMAYSPLAAGWLTGKYFNADATGRATLFKDYSKRYADSRVKTASLEYSILATENGMSSAQMALAYVRSRPFVTTTLLGATSLVRLEENIVGCLNTTLNDHVIERIEEVHQQYPNPAP